jgi:hypothetical protein
MRPGATKLNGIWRPCIIYNDDTVEVLGFTTVTTKREAIREAWNTIVKRGKKDRKIVEQRAVAKTTTVPVDSQ